MISQVKLPTGKKYKKEKCLNVEAKEQPHAEFELLGAPDS